MKMIIADLDGTLVLKKQVTQKTIETIKKIKEEGHLFTIATGRHMNATREMVRLFDVHLPVICGNGSIIYDFNQEKIIFQQTILDETVLSIMTLCDLYGVDFLLYTTKDIVATKKAADKLMSRIGSFDVKLVERSELESFITLGVIKVLVIDERVDVIESLKKALNPKKDIHYVQSQTAFLDIGHVLSTKGRALKILAEQLQMNMKNVIAIGDQENDISMIETAGFGISMGDGDEALKKSADYITQSFHDEGFFEAMKNLVLKK
jgi:Cof subfamily protein (haloacid dehalogenase superfamily)